MSQGALPRPTRAPEYLLRLRDKALARMAQDEIAATPRVTRRWMALATAAAVIAPRAFALRNAAPQYGAPGLPGNPPLPRPAAFASRSHLGSLDSWPKSSVTLVEEQSPKQSLYSDSHLSRTAYYRLPSGEPLSLNLVTVSSTSYVVRGPAAFYLSYDGELFGLTFQPEEVIFVPSLFKMPAGSDGEVISRFTATINDSDIERLSTGARTIRISVGNGSWQSAFGGIYSASISNGILQVGSLKIDLKTMQVVATPK